ncbi:hypothetical protein D3C72_1682360 [compost metagenome]
MSNKSDTALYGFDSRVDQGSEQGIEFGGLECGSLYAQQLIGQAPQGRAKGHVRILEKAIMQVLHLDAQFQRAVVLDSRANRKASQSAEFFDLPGSFRDLRCQLEQVATLQVQELDVGEKFL